MRSLVLLPLALALAAAEPPEKPEGPFQHKRHQPLKLKCNFCHAGKEERMGFPAAQAQCKTCHTAISERRIPSARVYKLRDFVVFSHAVHTAAKLECASCHGEVYKSEILAVFRPTTMAGCVDCHKEHQATVVCTACHELGQ